MELPELLLQPRSRILLGFELTHWNTERKWESVMGPEMRERGREETHFLPP